MTLSGRPSDMSQSQLLARNSHIYHEPLRRAHGMDWSPAVSNAEPRCRPAALTLSWSTPRSIAPGSRRAGESPRAVLDRLARLIHADGIVPAVHDGQAVLDAVAASAEADGVGPVGVLLRGQSLRL